MKILLLIAFVILFTACDTLDEPDLRVPDTDANLLVEFRVIDDIPFDVFLSAVDSIRYRFRSEPTDTLIDVRSLIGGTNASEVRLNDPFFSDGTYSGFFEFPDANDVPVFESAVISDSSFTIIDGRFLTWRKSVRRSVGNHQLFHSLDSVSSQFAYLALTYSGVGLDTIRRDSLPIVKAETILTGHTGDYQVKIISFFQMDTLIVRHDSLIATAYIGSVDTVKTDISGLLQ